MRKTLRRNKTVFLQRTLWLPAALDRPASHLSRPVLASSSGLLLSLSKRKGYRDPSTEGQGSGAPFHGIIEDFTHLLGWALASYISLCAERQLSKQVQMLRELKKDHLRKVTIRTFNWRLIEQLVCFPRLCCSWVKLTDKGNGGVSVESFEVLMRQQGAEGQITGGREGGHCLWPSISKTVSCQPHRFHTWGHRGHPDPKAHGGFLALAYICLGYRWPQGYRLPAVQKDGQSAVGQTRQRLGCWPRE